MTPEQVVVVAFLALLAIGMGNAGRIRERNLQKLRNTRQKQMHRFVTKYRGRRA